MADSLIAFFFLVDWLPSFHYVSPVCTILLFGMLLLVGYLIEDISLEGIGFQNPFAFVSC